MTRLLENRQVLGVIVVAMLAVPTAASMALAETMTIDIPLTTVIKDEPNTEHVLATMDVPPELVGATCDVVAIATNQQSVHPGNDLIVSSDDSSVRLVDVERAPGVVTEADGQLILSDVVTVTLFLGNDEDGRGTFSAGMTVEITCQPAPTTTTTTSTTEPPPTVQSSTTQTTTVVSSSTTVVESTTSTTASTVPTSSTQPPTTEAPETTAAAPATLPFTGSDSAATAGIGVSLLAAGALLVAASTRPEEGPTAKE